MVLGRNIFEIFVEFWCRKTSNPHMSRKNVSQNASGKGIRGSVSASKPYSKKNAETLRRHGGKTLHNELVSSGSPKILVDTFVPHITNHRSPVLAGEKETSQSIGLKRHSPGLPSSDPYIIYLALVELSEQTGIPISNYAIVGDVENMGAFPVIMRNRKNIPYIHFIVPGEKKITRMAPMVNSKYAKYLTTTGN